MNSQHFFQIENLFENIFQLLNTIFSKSEIEEVKSFIDVGEYGIAFETLCFIIDEENKTITKEAFALIETLGTSMMLESDAWKFINHRIEN